MGVEKYIVTNDRFELEEAKPPFSLDFPCNVCKYQCRGPRDEPCNGCGHNVDLDIASPIFGGR